MKLKSIQCLRAVAALVVVFDHVPRLEVRFFPHGFLHGFGAAGAIGVDLFFVISGFIMITTTWKDFGAAGAPVSFLFRRFARIYPAYWIALTVFLALGSAFPTAQHMGPRTIATVTTSALLIPGTTPPLLFVAWSLEFECFFYLLFALALRFPVRRLPLLVGLWCVATLLLNVVSRSTTIGIIAFLGSPLFFEFMGGCFVGYLCLSHRVVVPRAVLALGVVAGIGVAIYSSQFDGFGTYGLDWFRTLAAGPAMMLVVYGCASLEAQNRLAPPQWMVRLGDASYAMYLWHGMLLGAYTVVFAHLHIRNSFADVLFLAGALVVVIVGSLTIYRFIEQPVTGAARVMLHESRRGRRVSIAP